MEELVYLGIAIIVALLIARLFASWIFRIDDVISVLRKILKELEYQNKYRDE
jgi:hypothetical protein